MNDTYYMQLKLTFQYFIESVSFNHIITNDDQKIFPSVIYG